MPNLIVHLLLLSSLLISHHATTPFAAAAAVAGRCNRQCNGAGAPVPYPFGFSGDCPILLTCNATTSAALLPRSTPRMGYPVLSFDTAASTFLVAVAPSCNRTVRDAEAALTGPGFAVSYRTALFLRGGASSCRAAARAANGGSGCSVQEGLMNRILHTAEEARCAGAGNDTSPWTCVSALTDAAPPDGPPQPPPGGQGQGQFVRWETVRASGCEEALTAAVYGDALPQGVAASLEFGVAELAWWLDGTCATSRCAPDATCRDVATPSGGGAPGHRCACRDGTTGDGSADGDGCHAAATNSKNNVPLIVAGVLAGVAACAVVILLCRTTRRRRRSAAGRYSSAMRLLSEAAAASGVPVYSFHEVTRATNGFSHTHRLGTGAYGTVYVGRLPVPGSAPTPTLVAIKRLRYRHHGNDGDDATAAAAMLLNEIKLISSVSHPNLVRLLGCCLDRGEQILVYEYVPNGTLSQHLHHHGGSGLSLPWRARLGVAAETASAIAYLHGTRPAAILHRDVKSSNILLGGDLRPKLADFGLSRSAADHDASSTMRSHITTAPQGTPGYVDPEYHQNFRLSDKSDVYSFGVVLVELVTAMKVVDFDRPASEVNLASLALDRIGNGRVHEIVDPTLVVHNGEDEENWVMDSVRHVSELAFRCLAFHKDVRPCMSEVAAELCRIRAAAPAPVSSDSASRRLGLHVVDTMSFNSSGSAVTTVKKTVAAASPVAVHDVWVSDRSSPSTTSSVIMPRFL